MSTQTTIDLENFQITVGFDFDSLSSEAVAHERTDKFKQCVQNFMKRAFGEEHLIRAAVRRSVTIETETGMVENEDIITQARGFLEECVDRLSTTRIKDRLCRYSKDDTWEKARCLPIFCGDDPMTAREATEEYDRLRQIFGEAPLEENVRRELFALPMTVTVTWEVSLQPDSVFSEKTATP